MSSIQITIEDAPRITIERRVSEALLISSSIVRIYLTYLFVVVSFPTIIRKRKNANPIARGTMMYIYTQPGTLGIKKKETTPSRATVMTSKIRSTTIEEMPSEYVVL